MTSCSSFDRLKTNAPTPIAPLRPIRYTYFPTTQGNSVRDILRQKVTTNMTLTEATIAGVRVQFNTVLNDLRQALDGLDGEALNWRPVGNESSSIYMLVSHMMGMAGGMCAIAQGEEPQRDRAAEFAAAGTKSTDLLRLIDETQAKVEQALSSITEEMLASKREFVGNESTGAGLIVLMLRHLGEHLGHVALTRQLWEQLEEASG